MNTTSLLLVVALLALLGLWVRQNKQYQRLLKDFHINENRWRQIFETNTAIKLVIDPNEDRIVDVNSAACQFYGYSRAALLNLPLHAIHVLSDAETPPKTPPETPPTTAENDLYFNDRHRLANGEIRDVEIYSGPLETPQGNLLYYVIHDITSRKQTELALIENQQRLEEMANFDPLTHLPNRRLLADRMQIALARSYRNGQFLAVCMLDLDGFKPVNDNFGHKVGDLLLIEVAQRLQNNVRGEDTVARLGGDEFVILLGGLSGIKELDETMHRLLFILASPYPIANHTISVSASIGVTLHPSDNGNADTLLRHADHAMYLAKTAGKNRYFQFNPAIETRERDNKSALELIKKAVINEQLSLFYQPIVDCRRGIVVGMEALVRWQHPILGLMGPAEFLPLVEGDDKLACRVGEWVLKTALRQADLWREAGLHIPVSVNVFAQQLRDADFPQQILAALNEYPRLPPSQLAIEILESAAVDDFDSVIRLINYCGKLGVRFALDDFGTGFSSLTYLRRLPVNCLKIDQSFIHDMMRSPNDLAIIEGVISLCKTFRHQVIAEGVETTEHVLMLMEIGCNQVQGYGIAKPMPGDKTIDWIKHFQPDQRWLENAALLLSRDDFQLVLAEVNHRQWLANLQAWMRMDPAHQTAPLALDKHECNFGHWYYGEGDDRYGHMAEFRAAELLHDQVHLLAQQLTKQSQNGDITASRETEAELSQTSEKFRDLLNKIRLAVKSAHANMAKF